jgi:peptidoglycan-associated lipoprotein
MASRRRKFNSPLIPTVALRSRRCDYSRTFRVMYVEQFMRKVTSLLSASVYTLALTSLMSASGCSWFSSGSGDGEGLSESELEAQREGRFGSGGIPSAEGEGMFHDIHFAFDAYALDDQSRMDLESNARILQERSDLRITLEGHTDERGTVEYNMALGAERARAVKSALTAMGVSGSRLDSISYGEEIPLDQGHNEAAWAKNRRVHFSVGQDNPNRGGGSSSNDKY